MSLSSWAALSSICGTIVAVFALLYIAYQITLNRKVNQATFWLELRKMFSEHNEIHMLLRGGDWNPTAQDFPKIDAYMGLFEYCKHLLDEDLIDWRMFKSIYGYRVANIVANHIIAREKLIVRFMGWTDFLDLLRKLDYQDQLLNSVQEWFSTRVGMDWLQGQDGQNWLQTPEGKYWKHSEEIRSFR